MVEEEELKEELHIVREDSFSLEMFAEILLCSALIMIATAWCIMILFWKQTNI